MRTRSIPFLLLVSSLVGQQWTTTSVPPAARSSCGLAFQQATGRVLLFGGALSGGFSTGDTWEYDGTLWQQISTPTAPSPRSAPGMAYDIARSRVVLFGGATATGTNGETWEFDGGSWRQVAIAGPPHRAAPMVYDSARRRCVLYGGQQSPVLNALADTWEYDGVQWRQIATPGASPSVRSAHAMTYDAARGRVLLFGGVGGSPIGTQGDTWSYDGSAWTQLAATGPSARFGAAMTFDAQRGRAILFGGRNGVEFSDTWEFDGVWRQVSTAAAPAARYQGSLCYDLRNGRTTLFGGLIASTLTPVLGMSQLVPSADPSWTRYGIGCNGSHGSPTLEGAPGSVPRLGSTFVVHLGQLPVPPAVALLWLGFDLVQRGGAPLPLRLDELGLPGCLLWVDLATEPLLMQHTGTAIANLPIPADAALRGLVVGAQALVADVAGGAVVSNGLVMRVF